MGESRFRAPLELSATLLAALLGLVLWCGGIAGVAYFGLYLLALLPGLPIGWRLFGRGQPAGWIAGALIGYGLTALAFWVPIRMLSRELDLGVPSSFLRHAPADPGAARLEKVAQERLFRATDAFVDLDAVSKAGMMLLMHHNLIGRARYVGAKLWWRGSRPVTWGAAVRRARHADLVRQAWRNYRLYAKNVRG